MATSKSGPTLAALNAQIAALQAQADALRKKEVAEGIAKVKGAIAHYGLTTADLGFGKAAGRGPVDLLQWSAASPQRRPARRQSRSHLRSR